ncbi:MAG: adenylate/guanylate cyclase domain-containing protein [Candidatus Marinimicrobia bacterium]|nr:adenylate/guanylate cyclase domain-containing protein [Candidatus Neomarinimicrobiota bacterium]
MDKIIEKIKELVPSIAIGFTSIILVFGLHFSGQLDAFELKLIDLKFKLRGPLSGDDVNNKWPAAEAFDDTDGDGIFNSDVDFISSEGVGCWDDEKCTNNIYDFGEEFTDKGNGKWDSAEPFTDLNGDGFWNEAELFRDDNGNGKYEEEEPFRDDNENGQRDGDEPYADLNADGIWSIEEEFVDTNEDGIWNQNEEFTDIGNGYWNEGEPFTDSCECERMGEVCHTGKCVEYIECQDINQNGTWDKGLDVVLVELDDETFRLINEPMPYSRGTIWARTVRNLADAGAKVVVLDFMFDKPDHQTANLKNYIDNNNIKDFELNDGDQLFMDAIQYANSKGTHVILSSARKVEPTRIPPDYLLNPTSALMESDLDQHTGLVNINTDTDGFYRQYGMFYTISGDTTFHYTLGIESVLKYRGVYDSPPPILDADNRQITIGPLVIPTYGFGNTFITNYFGPVSGEFNTFSRYPLSNIVDTKDYIIGESTYDAMFDMHEYLEDTNWMDMYIDTESPLYMFFKDKNPFKNKIVVIGTSLAEDQDIKPIPYLTYNGTDYLMPGVEIHANAIQQMLHENYIHTPTGTLEYDSRYVGSHLLIMALFCLITLLLVTKPEPIIALSIMLVELVIWFSYSIGQFVGDYFWIFKTMGNLISENQFPINIPGMGESVMIPVLFPALSIILPYGLNLSYKLFTEGQDKAFLKASFGSYISPELIDQMYESKSAPSLGGEVGYNTAFFSDIASFSSFSEKLTAADLVELLNEYLNEMTNILLENNGTLDKYIGDAIIAFYGAPVHIDDHEYLACLTCCQMNDKLEELRQKWKSEGDRWPEVVHNMRHRIGVNCGELVTGNMGSDMRMNYTMMGDTVNLTARLESGAKQYGIETQVGSKIYEITKDRFTYRMLDYAVVKGRTEPERTFELISEKGKEPEVYKKLIPVWDQAIELYTNQKWDDAIKKFEECDKLEEDYIGRPTTPCKVYISRCEVFKENSPGKDWNGAFKLTSK